MGQDCKYCGAYVASRADRCPACGKRLSYKEPRDGCAAQRAEEKEQAPKTESAAYTYKDEYKQRYGAGTAADERTGYTAAPARPKAEPEDDVKKNQMISYLCYFGPLFLIPYLLRPNSAFVKFHANQGLVLLLASVLGGFLAGFVPLLGGLAEFAIQVLVFVGFVKGLINVSRGEKKELPIIGGIKLIK